MAAFARLALTQLSYRKRRNGNQDVHAIWPTAAALAAILSAAPAHAELSAEDLAKIAQNPVGNLISVPFQNNAYFNVGPLDGTQNVLNIQPVIPISISEDWNIITRTILPIISLPAFAPGQGSTSGIGDVQISAFLSPAKPGAWIWGAAPSRNCPRTAMTCSATTTRDSGRPSCFCTSSMAARGCTECSPTMSGR